MPSRARLVQIEHLTPESIGESRIERSGTDLDRGDSGRAFRVSQADKKRQFRLADHVSRLLIELRFTLVARSHGACCVSESGGAAVGLYIHQNMAIAAALPAETN